MLQNALQSVKFSGFLGGKIERHEREWVHKLFERDPNMFGAFFDREGNTLHKSQWHGEYPGKLLTGIAQLYRMTRNAETRKVGQRIADTLAQVQDEDGYLGPWSKAVRLDGDKDKWDTWGIYHCISGLLAWFEVTNDEKALTTARRAADQLITYFIKGERKITGQNWAEMNLSIGHAFARLYQVTGEKTYLDAAEYVVEKEWRNPYDDFFSKSVLACGWMDDALEGKAFYQTHQPRWEAQHAVMALAILYDATGKEEYRKAYVDLWQSVVDHDIHNFGGFGSGEGATGTPYRSGSETCSTVAWMAWSAEYLRLTRQSLAADAIELSYYNAALGSLPDDVLYTYFNVMEGERVMAADILGPAGFEGGVDMTCCQTNGLRGVSEPAEWAVLSEGKTLYWNFYSAGEYAVRLPSGAEAAVTVSDGYLTEGKVTLTWHMPKEETMNLQIRIPAWSQNAKVTFRGQTNVLAQTGCYYPIEGTFSDGDTVELAIDLTCRKVSGDDVCQGMTSVYYGAILLCRSRQKEGEPCIVPDTPHEVWNPTLSESSLQSVSATSDGDTLLKITPAEGEPLLAYCNAWTKGKEYSSWFKLN